MKQVLLIGESDIFRDYIQNKLSSQQIETTIGVSALDSLLKFRSIMPDLAIIDFNNTPDIFDLLEKKSKDPNAKDIPVILLVRKISKEEVSRLSAYKIKKMISMPLKIDQLFLSITEILHIDFDIDNTPCILEARVNENIIFIEIAQGLNREKINLLKYKIRELISLYNLIYPKVLIMMTDLSLSFVDGPNLELLLNNILTAADIKNIKVLTLDSFAQEFISGNKEYSGIQIVTDLSKALDSLVKNVQPDTDTSTVISERILSVQNQEKQNEAAIEMRFNSELEVLKTVARNIKIAVVDDDVVIRTILSKTFHSINANVELYETGNAFLSDNKVQSFDLIFLDLMMPGITGFEVLKNLRAEGITTPVIVLSAISQREAVLKVLSSGVKSYMIKPLKPESILKKAIEVLQESI